jgi:hypothetical protein
VDILDMDFVKERLKTLDNLGLTGLPVNDTQIVEMRIAYVWDCENCGTENFERAVVYEFSPEEIADAIADGDSELAQTGNWMTHPNHVKCRKCSAEFAAKHFRTDDDSFVEQE